MSYRKSIKGDENVQNEQLSHNRIVVEGGQALNLLTVFCIVLVSGSIALVAILHWALFESLIVASFVGFFIVVWIAVVLLVRRQISATKTAIAVNETERTQAQIKANILHATENYILWRDPDGSYQFRGSTVITENRQFMPTAIAAPNQQEAILECYDQGMSGRSIEKWLKDRGDKKITYHQIAKTLNLFRPEWNKKTVESGQSEDEHPV